MSAERRRGLTHPWHVEAALRAALSDATVVVRRLHDTLRGDPRFVVEAPNGRAVELACKVPDAVVGFVLIEPFVSEG